MQEGFQEKMTNSKLDDGEPICPTPISFYIPTLYYNECDHVVDNPTNELYIFFSI